MKDINKINILNEVGLLTDEQRKLPLQHGCHCFTFETCIDLSKPIKVIPYGNYKSYSIDDYSRDVAEFFTWWSREVLKDLNGFSGYSNLKFELIGFKLI